MSIYLYFKKKVDDMILTDKNVAPFIKWAGGKRQLLPYIQELMPKTYDNYYEPFIGGGAVLFHLMPQKEVIINDINKALVNVYRQIKYHPNELMQYLTKIDADIPLEHKAYYYEQREQFNDKMMKDEYDLELAALFIYLNKHCFNGLYRVNSKGLFNVPFNNSNAKSFNAENILAVSHFLQKVTILEGDFEHACQNAKKGDFIFLDSPYAPLNDTSFEAYTKEGFDIPSHKRLAKLFEELNRRGCYCMLTNHNTEFINDLYQNYNKKVITVRRYINSDAKNRKGEEIIITNY